MPDNITFQTIPVTILTGGVFAEIDNSKAVRGLPQQPRKVLLVGQKLSTGSAVALKPVSTLNAADAASKFGQGSMLHRMAIALDAAKAMYGFLDVYAVPMDDLAAGVVATGSIVITGTATQAGTLYAYVGGNRVSCAVNYNDSAATVAAALAAAINARTDLPVTASARAATVTVTCRHKGDVGNGLELALTYYEDDKVPSGISAVCNNLSGGSGNPDVATALAAIAADWYYTIICPYTDNANLAALETEMTNRFGGMDMRTGHIFNAKVGTHGTLTTFGAGRNSPHVSTWGLKGCPTWTPEMAAAFAGVCEISGANDPAMPLCNLQVPGVLAPRLADRFSRNERELLLRDGISTTKEDAAGNLYLERVITNYQTNPSGAEDESLLRLETKWTVDYFRYAMCNRIALRYPRYKLADDGTNVSPGQKVVTPSVIRAELIAQFMELENAGLVENLADFKANLIVLRSTADVDRINAVVPPNLINQFRVFAAAVQYQL